MDYQLALSLCLAYFNGVQNGDIIITGNGAAREKELLDIAIKSAIRIGSEEQAYSLALRALPHPTLTGPIAEALIFSNHPRGTNVSAYDHTSTLTLDADAISVVLKSSSMRSRDHPFFKLLSGAFAVWEQQLSNSESDRDREHEKLDIASIHTLHTILEGLVQRTACFSPPLFSENEPSFKLSLRARPAPVMVEEKALQQLCSGAKLEDAEVRQLVRLLTSSEAAEYQGDSDYKSARTM